MDEPLSSDELGSELTGLNKGEKNLKNKQIMVGIIAGTVLFILILVIIILVATSGGDEENKKKEEKKEEKKDRNKIGEINLTYDIKSSEKKTVIIGDEYKKESDDFDIYINGTLIEKYTKEYQFSKIGKNQVQLKLYSSINMDNMFKNIED